MPRYFVTCHPLTDYPDWSPSSDHEPLIEGRTIFEPTPVKTGLLAADGRPIWKSIDAIGFTTLKER